MVESSTITGIAIFLGSSIFQEALSRGIDLSLRARGEKAAKKKLQSTIEAALDKFSKAHPELAVSLFDSTFIEAAKPELLRLFETRNKRPRAKELARLYSKQLSSGATPKGLVDACEDFIKCLEDAIENEPLFQKLMDSREISQNNGRLEAIQEELQQGFQSILGSLPPVVGEYITPPLEIDNELIVEKLGCRAADLLTWPQTLPTGDWIERPELGKLHEFATSRKLNAKDKSIAILLGAPGCGKSALLARLGTQLRSQGTPLLALKADSLPDRIDTANSLEEYLDLPESLELCLANLTATDIVVVLIDQLDALSSLLISNPGRLNALIDLIWIIKRNPKVRIILSCRTFEHKYDARFSQLDAEEVRLSNLAWPDVAEILKKQDISSASWTEEFRRILLTPQHLNVFLEYSTEQADRIVYTSYRGMLQDIWERRVALKGTGSAACAIAEMMAQREELWVPIVLFEDEYFQEILSLEQNGIIVRQGKEKIGFRHQTIFDFARAKSHIKKNDSLSKYIFERQNSLFIRSTIWSTLDYLREMDCDAYSNELTNIWTKSGLRKHLRYLLIEFMGRFETPLPCEERLLLPWLADKDYRPKICSSIASSTGWFKIIEAEQLPQIMGLEMSEAWSALPVVANGIKYSPDRCTSLIRKHWLKAEEYKRNLYWVITSNYSPVDSVDDLLFSLADDLDLDPMDIERVVEIFVKHAPLKAANFLSKHLDKRLNKAMATAREELRDAVYDDENEMANYIRREFDNNRPLTDLISDHDWHNLNKSVVSAPKELVPILFSWFANILSHVAHQKPFNANCYTEDHCLDSYDREHPSPFMVALREGIKEFAETEPDAFIALANSWLDNELMGVHRILILGIMALAPHNPDYCLSYLLEDNRRLAVGDISTRLWHSTKLIEALTPHLSAGQAYQLEKQVINWSFNPKMPGDGPEELRRRMRWDQEKRLTLLNVFPTDRLSDLGKKFLREGKNAGLRYIEHPQSTNLRWIGPSLSAERMEKAKDSHILNLFSMLTDEVEDHPRNWRRGGSRQTSTAFGDFAKKDPNRALRIMKQFIPGRQDNPTGEGFRGIAGSEEFSRKELETLFLELVERGFSSDGFKSDCALALRDLSYKQEGLSIEVCNILKNWISKFDSTSDEPEKPQSDGSILWSHSGMRVIPSGNYTILDALTGGFLCRTPPLVDEWVTMLADHIGVPENSSVWRMFISRNLRWLNMADAEQANSIVRQLFLKHPKYLRTEDTIFFLAYAHHWLDNSIFQTFLEQLQDGQWDRGPQAVGELITLRAALYPDDEWCQKQLAEILCPQNSHNQIEELRIGCAWSASGLWGDTGRFDSYSEEIQTQLATCPCSGNLAKAMLDMFRAKGPMRYTASLKRMLEKFREQPEIMMAACESYLSDRLMEIVGSAPDLVAGVSESITATEFEKKSRSRAFHLDHLVQLSLALHRMPKYQDRALSMFENLISLQAHSAVEALRDLTRYPVN
ncbi:ATP-binding protein [Pseudodesulfovibrio indicus]|uniref:ATP-binding protein n=1 Tax=Pseudodesulfovibrio indicus TaxID=1716143 RepID=UPI00292CA731|nr:ATP-binding protein [Pseudodesulfovibrio indicus]